MNDFDSIPFELRRLDQWVCSSNDHKIPMQATRLKAASSTDPATWSPFSIAKQAVEKGKYEYVGFVFNDNSIVGIDIDDGYDEDGFLTPLAADIIGACESYTERSKSGRGVHIFLYGELPFKGKNNLAGVEIYRSARYFITTGNAVLFYSIQSNQNAIDYVVEKYFPDTQKDNSDKTTGNRIYTPQWEKPVGNRIKLRPVYPLILEGGRNICLTSLAGFMHNVGYSREHIYDELIYANQVACQPMLSTYELDTIVNSVTRYKR